MSNIVKVADSLADMKKILAYYGYTLNRGGFIRCPFHNEKTASLKLYANNTRWHCFGCGAGGAGTDFVRRMEGVDAETAAARVNDICALGLPVKGERPTLKQLRHIREITERIERERAELEKANAELDELISQCSMLDRIILAAAPKSPDEEISDTYAEALKIKPYYDYLYESGGSA